jgi:hypothetical protein
MTGGTGRRGASGRAGILLAASVLACSCARREAPPAAGGAPPEPEPAEGPPAASPDDGHGTARLLSPRAVRCGSWGSWTVEWVAGPPGLAAGGGVVLQVPPFWGWTPPQVDRPGTPGYTTLRATGAAVFDVAVGAVAMTVVARVREGRAGPGDTLRFVYGDSTLGGVGSLCRADMYAEDFERFLVKVDGDGDGVFEPIAASPGLRILPGSPVRLAVAQAATVRPGEPFEVRVHALDERENLAELPPGRLQLRLQALPDSGAVPSEVLVERTVRGGAFRDSLRVPAEGLFRLEAALVPADPSPGVPGRPDALRGVGDLLLVAADSPFEGILWGDIHAHSGLSDGTGAPAALYAYGRDVAGLDVCAVTDHDAHGLAPLAEGGFEELRAATRAAYVPGRFVTLLGYEWTSWTWGHRNVYYPGDAGEVFEFRDERSDTPGELWAAIAPFGGITIPHHPAGGPVAVDWSVPSDEERERVVEICSIHGSSEFPGAERGIYRPVDGAFVRDALGDAHRLGLIASGDGHDGHPGRRTAGAATNGLAAFRAAERTREAVLAALSDRRVYGTSGPRILLATEWGGHAPGRDLDAWPHGPLTVRVAAPSPVQVVEVVAAGGVVARAWGGGRRPVHVFEEVSPGASSWVYVRVELGDGETAWDSPWYLTGAGG